MTSLKNLCFVKVIQDLENYPPELLALLPPTLRRPLLLHMPIVDLCQLEDTCVFDGLNAGMIWNDRFESDIHPYLRNIENMSGVEGYQEYNAEHCDIQFDHLKTLIQPNYFDGILMQPNFRRNYFAAIMYAIFEYARPTGYYQIPNSFDHEFVDIFAIDVQKYGLQSQPADFVNYLVAGASFNDENICHVEEKFELTWPVPEWELDNHKHRFSHSEIDYSPYIEISKLFQFIPPRYSKYLNEDNLYRLSEEDALTLLMEKCKYYPEEVHINVCRYASIRWEYEDEKLKSLVGKFFCKTLMLKLLFTYFSDLEEITDEFSDEKEMTEEEENEPNSGSVLEPLLSSTCPHLCSLTLKNARGEDIRIVSTFLALPNSPYQLTSVSVDGFITAPAAEALGKMFSTQFKLSFLEISSCSSHSWNLAAESQFIFGIESYLRQPTFEHFSFESIMSKSVVERVITSFLTSPSSHSQSVELRIPGNLTTEFQPTHEKLNVSKSALEYKSLEITLWQPSDNGIDRWLFALQPLQMKKLKLHSEYCSGYHDISTLDVVTNSSLNIQTLHLGVIDFSTEAFKILLQNHTLRELEIVLGNEVNLDDVTSGLLKQTETGTLEVLKLIMPKMRNNYYGDRSGYIKLPANSNVEHFVNTILSLPQKNQFSLEIGIMINQESDVINIIETIHKVWKTKNVGYKLTKFALGFDYNFQLTTFERPTHVRSRILDERVLSIANEMAMEVHVFPF